jgi:hypothetical protein
LIKTCWLAIDYDLTAPEWKNQIYSMIWPRLGKQSQLASMFDFAINTVSDLCVCRRHAPQSAGVSFLCFAIHLTMGETKAR